MIKLNNNFTESFRSQIWVQAGDGVYNQVREQIWILVNNQILTQGWNKIENQIRTQVRIQVGNKVIYQLWY